MVRIRSVSPSVEAARLAMERDNREQPAPVPHTPSPAPAARPQPEATEPPSERPQRNWKSLEYPNQYALAPERTR